MPPFGVHNWIRQGQDKVSRKAAEEFISRAATYLTTVTTLDILQVQVYKRCATREAEVTSPAARVALQFGVRNHARAIP